LTLRRNVQNQFPAYVEMGSTNPIFVLPGALAERTDSIVQRLTASINLGVGQFCTCPGLVFGLQGDAWTTFSQKMEQAFERIMPGTMLHPGIARSYEESVARVAAVKGVSNLRSKQVVEAEKTEAMPTIFETEIGTWLSNEILSEEIFGPAAILVRGSSEDECPAPLPQPSTALRTT
jgi:2,5-dioxopentanoate dehydrogenase